MNRYLTIHIPEAAVPMPISRFLRTQAGLTKKQISQAKFRPGGIRKNGQQCRVTETAYPGDQITVCLETDDVDSAQLESATFTVNSDRHKSCFHHSTSLTLCSYSNSDSCCLSASTSHFFPELEILYEDQDILAINKPAGIVTHPSGSHYSDSLSNQVASYFRSKEEPTKVRSIGRLDKETSGILLFARNQISAARLQKQREEGKLQKTYLAVVERTFEEEISQSSSQEMSVSMEKEKWEKISIPLAPDPENPLKMVLSPAGTIHGSKKAVTYYQVLKSYANASLVQLHLETGRTHQIRVHMAGTGHPLLGDTLYNESQTGKASVPGNPFTRAALHAWKLKFYHPFTGNKILLEAPFPLDFENFLEKK